MILSVPHTGTRTLQKVLDEVEFFHFCQNEVDFETRDDHIDFPIRDPLATSVSWRCYQSDRTDMDEFRRWEAAIAYLSDKYERTTVHRMEHLPVLEGASSPENRWKQAVAERDLDTLKELPEVRYLLDWIRRPEISQFFEEHYPEGFWWRDTEQQNS